MKISDEAVEAAAQSFYGSLYGQGGEGGNAVMRDVARAALEAAVPYLMPDREALEQRIRRVYIDGGAHITHAQEAAAEIVDAIMPLLRGSEVPSDQPS